MPSMIEIILLIILHIWLCRQGGDHFWSESRLNISLLMLKVEHLARGKGLRLDKSQSSQTPGFSLAFAGLFIATKVKMKWSTKTGHRVRVFPVSIFRFVWG